jgi:hypothetical protein
MIVSKAIPIVIRLLIRFSFICSLVRYLRMSLVGCFCL